MQLSTFKTYVKYDFKREDKDTELVQAYNDMILWIATMMPHGGYKYQSYINTVVGQEDYALPSDMIHLIHPARLLDGSGSADSGYDLEFWTKEKWSKIEPNPNRTSPHTGKPYAYTVFSRQLLLTSIPDSADYIVEIDWSKRPTDQSADSDTPYLGDEWREILKFGTLERLYDGLGMSDEALIWSSKYKDPAGNPIGMCKRLFEIEDEREEKEINISVPNNL